MYARACANSVYQTTIELLFLVLYFRTILVVVAGSLLLSKLEFCVSVKYLQEGTLLEVLTISTMKSVSNI